MFKKGFYCALGTPLDENGNLLVESFKNQIEYMIEAGASGLLCMGSMGAEAGLTNKTYKFTAETASKTVNGRVPLLIGAMDNSVFKVKERIEMLNGLNYDGIVLTAPFYQMDTQKNLIKFFKDCADVSEKPVYLYDLPVITKQKITFDMVKEIAKHPNIKGVKSIDTVLCRQIKLELNNFEAFHSNLDAFDVGVSFGIDKVLDGMFACMPKTSKKVALAIENGDIKALTENLSKMIKLRNILAESGIWPGFTIAMNLLNLEGDYGYGYMEKNNSEEYAKKIESYLKEIGEI